ncbi:MAG: MBL fold metallo-hydrolase RNA specificity domain-containing protein [Bacteroidia bacterium]
MNKDVSIQFLGAAATVTGSKHLLKTPEKNILIDCGLFQGIKSLRLRNWQPLPVATGQINLVILTHAHLDHCGYLPLLVKAGYKGDILMTAPTRDLVEVILRDSAKIQEEDAEYANKHRHSKHKPALPLYTLAEVEQTLTHCVTRNDNEWIQLSPNIRFRFLKNGHILGSAFIDTECFGKKIVFSGDIGREKSEIMFAPSIVEDADFLVMESTYGNKLHPAATAKAQLADIINATIRRKGNLLIPSFAVGRAQELMHIITVLKKEKHIPDIPVYMDSPMGADVITIMDKYPGWHKLSEKEYTAMCNNITIIRNYHETAKVIQKKGSKIIIAASGMLTGGRILAYIKNDVGHKRNTVALVGYQAEGTRGRALQEGAHEIKIHGKYYAVNAQISTISSLSGHADQGEMINWLKQFKKRPAKIFLVHGEPMAQEAFRIKIKDELNIEVKIPQQDEEILLFNT